MGARDILILGAGAAALLLLSRRASAMPHTSSPIGPLTPYASPFATAPGAVWWDTAPGIELSAPTVQDIEDAEMFQRVFPNYIETATPHESGEDGPYSDAGGNGIIHAAGGQARNLDAFLRLIRRLEVGTDGPEGYARVHTAVGRKMGADYLTSLADHPRVRVPYGTSTTSAAGAYQFQEGTWDSAARALGLPDFSPASQDAAAVYLIKGRGALPDIVAGKIKAAVAKLRKEWSSLPGAKEAQLDQSNFDRLYMSFGGGFAPGDGGAVYA